MNANRFDTISKLFASHKTRRSVIAGGVGLTAAAVAPPASRTVAQDATPEVIAQEVDPNNPHPGADDAQADPEFLFVQPFDAGTWAPKDGEDGVYTLTLTGAAANTVYFSDRPERIVGLAPNDQFLDGLGFTPENPPNAAIVAQTAEGEQDVLVIELFDPTYDADAETLIYDATVLADYGEHGLAHLARQQQDYEIGETFGQGGLFIDGCSDKNGFCVQTVDGEKERVGWIGIGTCWINGASLIECGICNSEFKSAYYGTRCADLYPDTCFYKYIEAIDGVGWNCTAELQ